MLYKNTTSLFALIAVLSWLPATAHAQQMAYDDTVLTGGDSGEMDSAGDAGDSSEAPMLRQRAGKGRRGGSGDGYTPQGGRSFKISPYIEAAQVFTSNLGAGGDSVTYTRLAVGVDSALHGRNNDAAVSLRYERQFGYGKYKGGDVISGIGRVSAGITNGVRFETGALATQTRVEGSGAAAVNTVGRGGGTTRLYSAYAGPSVSTHLGNVAVTGQYRFGYTKMETPTGITPVAGQGPTNYFNHSTSHNATVRAGISPGQGLPVGIGIGGGYNREDMSNLDQRIEDRHARADVTVPVTSSLAVVGGVGYEKVTISHRDALRDTLGNPIVGTDGNVVTNKAGARQIAFNTSGLIWDAGVMWRPSRRTSLAAYVGRRYGSRSVWGAFSYAPNDRSNLSVAVYDSVSGLGSQVNAALANLSPQFAALRNPLSGDLTGCVGGDNGGSCGIAGALGTVRSGTYRMRGVTASYGMNLGQFQTGIGAGYNRYKFIAAPGTVLAAANGTTDENIWVSSYFNGQLGENSSFATNFHANWFKSGSNINGDSTAIGATAAYYRSLGKHLSANAAVGIDGIKRKTVPNIWNASALVGVKYAF